jgi:Carboxypeptidase regulatory-like domain
MRLHAIALGDMFAGVLHGGRAVLVRRGRVGCRSHSSPTVDMRSLVTIALLLSVARATRAQSVGRIEGAVFDSLRSAPLAGARLRATRLDAPLEMALVAESDKRGRFVLERVPAGRYAIGFASALLDSLEYGGPSTQITVEGGRDARVDLALPSRKTLRAAACPGVEFENRTGALLGLVTDAETDGPIVGAAVAVAWSELAIDTASKAVKTDERGVRVTTDAAGQYRLCGVPSGEWLLVQVQHAGNVGPVLRVTIADAVGVAVRNLSFGAGNVASLATGTASLVGTVRREGPQPVRGAEVRVRGTAGATRTDERGEYALTGLPSGTYEVEVRQLGFGIARGPVELRAGRRTRQDVELARVVALDSIRVVAQRVRYPDFESRRRRSVSGRFLDEDEITRRHAIYTSEIVATLPGYHLVGDGLAAKLYSSREPNCPVNVVIDRVPNQQINDVTASEIGAIESYPNGGGMAQYRAPCGMLVIWTKR